MAVFAVDGVPTYFRTWLGQIAHNISNSVNLRIVNHLGNEIIYCSFQFRFIFLLDFWIGVPIGSFCHWVHFCGRATCFQTAQMAAGNVSRTLSVVVLNTNSHEIHEIILWIIFQSWIKPRKYVKSGSFDRRHRSGFY